MRGLGLLIGFDAADTNQVAPLSDTDAILFADGTRLDLSDTENFAPSGNISAFSAGMWLRIDELPETYCSFFVLDASLDHLGGDSYFWLGWDSSAGGSFGARGPAIYGPNAAHALNLLPIFGAPASAGEFTGTDWFHLAVTWDAGTVKIYLNGVLCSLDTGGTSLAIGQSSYNQIDRVHLGNELAADQSFVGGMRAAFITGDILTHSQIIKLMNDSDPLASGVGSFPLRGSTDLADTLGNDNLTVAAGSVSTTTATEAIGLGYVDPRDTVDYRTIDFATALSLTEATITNKQGNEYNAIFAAQTRSTTAFNLHGGSIPSMGVVTSGKEHVADIILKPDGRDWLLWQVAGASHNFYGIINPATETVGDNSANCTFSFTALGNGWVSVRMTFTTTDTEALASNTYHATDSSNYVMTGDVSKGFLFSTLTLSHDA